MPGEGWLEDRLDGLEWGTRALRDTPQQPDGSRTYRFARGARRRAPGWE